MTRQLRQDAIAAASLTAGEDRQVRANLRGFLEREEVPDALSLATDAALTIERVLAVGRAMITATLRDGRTVTCNMDLHHDYRVTDPNDSRKRIDGPWPWAWR
jgi:hypothetical protein